jgi:hypothetical protein
MPGKKIEYLLYSKFTQYVAHTVNRVATLSGIHSIMRVKLAQAGEDGGARPPPFTTFTITSKVAMYAPAKWTDTVTLFHL